MNSKTAESIIIKVGHGIMRIPRNTNKTNKHENYADKKGQLQESIKKTDLREHPNKIRENLCVGKDSL